MLLLQYSSAFSAQGCPLRQGRYPFQIQYSSGHTIESLVESAEPGLSLIPPQPPSPSVELCWKVACQEALPTSLGTLPRRRTSVPDISEQVCVAGGGGGGAYSPGSRGSLESGETGSSSCQEQSLEGSAMADERVCTWQPLSVFSPFFLCKPPYTFFRAEPAREGWLWD